MDYFQAIGDVVPARNLIPGDMVLCGDKVVGMPAFCIIETMLFVAHDRLNIRLENGHLLVIPSTQEVVRL